MGNPDVSGAHETDKLGRSRTPNSSATSKTQVQLLAETRAPSPAELASMEGEYNPDIGGKTKADFFMETGMTPEMSLLRLLDAHGGAFPQTDLVAKTGWPLDAIHYLLADVEQAGYITRSQSNDSLFVMPPANNN